MAGDFTQRMRELEDAVGAGRLTGSVTVDQVYAHMQHEALDFKHPEGGQAKYLEQPLYDNAHDYVQRLAKDAVTDTGSQLVDAMRENMEHLSLQVFENAPFEFGDLKASGHPTVKDGEVTAYDRPPNVHRLTDSELRAKGHLRALGFGHGEPAY